ncbi:hypothetical protein N656DRAFT_782331 [Canariomyces notabilis]|uniref:Uncharacterized protein n=1 Tax=Canariomyces notabilis TaxID=2074819 RepID=A0AAN6TA31_9PEZI|nr:hypothetical protein N656DRAFT_782331 [Canariomyces arenarius]
MKDARTPRSTSTPRNGIGTTTSVRFHHPTKDSQSHAESGLRSFSGARPGTYSTIPANEAGYSELSRRPLGATAIPGPLGVSQSSRQPSSRFELPRTILRPP